MCARRVWRAASHHTSLIFPLTGIMMSSAPSTDSTTPTGSSASYVSPTSGSSTYLTYIGPVGGTGWPSDKDSEVCSGGGGAVGWGRAMLMHQLLHHPPPPALTELKSRQMQTGGNALHSQA